VDAALHYNNQKKNEQLLTIFLIIMGLNIYKTDFDQLGLTRPVFYAQTERTPDISSHCPLFFVFIGPIKLLLLAKILLNLFFFLFFKYNSEKDRKEGTKKKKNGFPSKTGRKGSIAKCEIKNAAR
jgi:hypothetical protein